MALELKQVKYRLRIFRRMCTSTNSNQTLSVPERENIQENIEI